MTKEQPQQLSVVPSSVVAIVGDTTPGPWALADVSRLLSGWAEPRRVAATAAGPDRRRFQAGSGLGFRVCAPSLRALRATELLYEWNIQNRMHFRKPGA